MVYKSCPACKASVPVATKYCGCGHVFFNKRLYHPKLPVKGDHANSLSRRRTERVSRGRPAYYSASEFENPFRRHSTSNRSPEKPGKTATARSKSVDQKASPSPRKRRKKPGRPRTLHKKKESKDSGQIKEKDKNEKVETDEFEMYANNSAERKFTFAVTLAEINRKLGKEWNGPRGNIAKETTDSTASR